MFIDAVEVRANPAGMVLYMSDWFRCDEFVARGFFRAEFGGPETMGDTFFYLTDAGRAQSEIEACEPFVPMGAN